MGPDAPAGDGGSTRGRVDPPGVWSPPNWADQVPGWTAEHRRRCRGVSAVTCGHIAPRNRVGAAQSRYADACHLGKPKYPVGDDRGEGAGKLMTDPQLAEHITGIGIARC